MPIALTRGVSASLASCELTHLTRTPIDLPLARSQHASYEGALRRAGCRIIRLPVLDEYPDAVFVEDTAIVLDEIAVVTRPGALPRRPEVESVARALAEFREVAAIEEPGTLDGGDVLRLGRRVYVGQSGRSNESGIDQLRALLAPYGYSVTGVPVTGCLHLKSAVTEISPGVVLVNRRWVEPDAFGDVEIVDVDPAEPYAANGLLVSRPDGSGLIYPASSPRTRDRLEARGISLEIVDVSELQKAEGAVTCCSLVFRA